MNVRGGRIARTCLGAAAGVLAATAASWALRVRPARAETGADASAPGAAMTCERLTAPGRMRCVVEARVAEGASIRWGDVVLVATPPFVEALRGRTGPHDATAREPTVWRWDLGLLARSPGEGAVEGRARLVVCREGVCSSTELPFQGRAVVGR